jgi:hypothetical protein
LLLYVLAYYCRQRVGATARVQWKHVQGLGTRDCVIRFPPSKGDKLHTVPVMKRELHEKLVLMRELTQPQGSKNRPRLVGESSSVCARGTRPGRATALISQAPRAQGSRCVLFIGTKAGKRTRRFASERTYPMRPRLL